MGKFTAFLSVALALYLSGCRQLPTEKKGILAKINDYEISRQEFEEEFLQSSFGRNDTPEARKDFLSNLIDRKIILQEAQALGMDKQKDFLMLIERFWEQSLLKIALDKKGKEISALVSVDDRAVEELYKKMAAEGKTDRPYDQMYRQLKWEAMKTRESQMMNEWITQLRQKASIKINEDSLGAQ